MKNEIIIALTFGLYNTYTVSINEKEILYQSVNNSIYNTNYFMYVISNFNKFYFEFTKYRNCKQEKKFHVVFIGDDKIYRDVTDAIPKKLLHEYMRMYVNINGI